MKNLIIILLILIVWWIGYSNFRYYPTSSSSWTVPFNDQRPIQTSCSNGLKLYKWICQTDFEICKTENSIFTENPPNCSCSPWFEYTNNQCISIQKRIENSIPREYISALNQADVYANKMHMSQNGVYDQLISEYGGQFSIAAAQYAVDNVKSDWNQNALAQAKNYQNTMNMSPAAIHDQLISEYGGQFTTSQADYAIQNLDK